MVRRGLRAFTTILVRTGFGIIFSFSGFMACFFARSLCINLGFRWGILADMGSIGVFALGATLGGAILGVIVGKKLCCADHKG